MKTIKLPSYTVLIIGSLAAFWIADIINPGFNPIGLMILLLIPIFIIEFLYPQDETKDLFEEVEPEEETEEEVEEKEPVSGELLDDGS